MSDKSKGSIIVVDDDESIRRAMYTILRNEGYEVMAALNGRDALEVTSRRKFDLMFLDIMMPGFNGQDVLTLMRASRPEMPIVMITAFNDPKLKDQAMRLGAHDFVTKPFDMKDIVRLADSIIRSGEEKEEVAEVSETDAGA
ncbi:MAG: response regulator [Dehalococcoidia bacterium]